MLVSALLTVLAAAPTDLDLATELYQQGEFERALNVLATLSETAGSNDVRSRAFLYRAYSEALLGQHERAAASFERALSADPELQPDRARVHPAVIKLFDAVRARLHGRLVVTSDRTAEVFVNGHPHGSTPFDASVAIGRYELEVRSVDRVHGAEHSVVVGPGAEVRVEAVLQQRTGKLSLASSPNGCGVFEGDRQVATTPIADWVLPAGPHQFVLRRQGFQPYALEARIDPDRPVAYTLVLEPEASGRLWLLPAVLGGTSLAMLAGGVTLGVLADRDSSEIQRGGAIETTRYNELRPRARNAALAANIAYGLAGASALAAALTFWFTDEATISASVSTQGVAMQGTW